MLALAMSLDEYDDSTVVLVVIEPALVTDRQFEQSSFAYLQVGHHRFDNCRGKADHSSSNSDANQEYLPYDGERSP